jgi:predicted Fe-Mo cluster-binding NifX family protein
VEHCAKGKDENMKIAVTSVGSSIDDTVETRFGRCAYFLVIDMDTLEWESIQNPNIALGGGAGIQSAQLLADRNVAVVLTGNCGPNAFRTFGAAGIRVITGINGTVKSAVEQFKSGELTSASEPNVQSHFGTGMGKGMGGGRGLGRGAGMGRGIQYVQSAETAGTGDTVEDLQKQAQALQEQMEKIMRRIRDMEEKS